MDSSPRSALVIHPMGVTGVVDAGFNLARRNYRVLVRTTAIGLVPAYVVLAFIGLLTGNGSGLAGLDRGRIATFGLVIGVGGLVAAIAFVLATIAPIIACARLIAPTGQIDELQPRSLYGAAWGRLGRVILWSIVIGFCSLTLILPPLGIYLLFRWFMSYYFVIIEGDGPIRGLGRSWNLTRKAWWHTFGVTLVGGLAVGTVSYLILAIFGAIGTLISVTVNASLGSVVSNLGSFLGTAISAPFSAAIMVVLYYELRARNEGLDLVTRAEQAAGNL